LEVVSVQVWRPRWRVVGLCWSNWRWCLCRSEGHGDVWLVCVDLIGGGVCAGLKATVTCGWFVSI